MFRQSAKSGGAVPVAILVAASVTLSICLGLRNSLGLFLAPMATDLGITAGTVRPWRSRCRTSSGVSRSRSSAPLADRIGARPVLAGSAAFYAAGLLAMSLSRDPGLGLGLGGGLLVGIGVAGTGFGVLLGAVSRAVPPAPPQLGRGNGVSRRVAGHHPDRAHGTGADRDGGVGGQRCWRSP